MKHLRLHGMRTRDNIWSQTRSPDGAQSVEELLISHRIGAIGPYQHGITFGAESAMVRVDHGNFRREGTEGEAPDTHGRCGSGLDWTAC